MFKKIITICLLTASPLVADDACEDLWLARNIILDKAGACFSSFLGKSTFNNVGCKRGADPALSDTDLNRVAAITQREGQLNCKVNTRQERLRNVTSAARRHRLAVQPIANATERACLGYKGPRVGLFSAPDAGAQQFGFVEPGDDIYWLHDNEGEWAFITRKRPGFDMVGWSRQPIDACTQKAG